MPSPTTTIRVSRTTRDLLAEEARDRGVSLAALLAEIARDRRRTAIWESEHAAARVDAHNRESQLELRDWEATVDDGLS